MANQEHVDLLKQGVAQWNAWRKQHPAVRPDLYRAELSQAELSGADLISSDLIESNLSDANLSGVKLAGFLIRSDATNSHMMSGSNLSRADLSRADLSGAKFVEIHPYATGVATVIATLNGANLSEANLRGANLSYAALQNANLKGADLIGANLSGAKLSRTDLSEAILGWTSIAEIDLRTARGLIAIQHRGPSRLELSTIQLPPDGSALHFLRGAGVPDEWINFWRITAMHPIQYHSLFISYSSKDEILARRLHADLQAKGVRCWFAPEDMKIGDKIQPRIDEAINIQDKLLLLLSEHSIASTWVEDEVEAAMEKEHQQQREVLFPVRLDESVMQTMQAWAAKLRRTRHIGNFTSWTDPQAYQRAFERLLRDLKAEKTPDGK